MKLFTLIFTVMMSINLSAQDGKATTTKKRFSTTTAVSIKINAAPAIIWALLTNGDDITRWNSTLTYFKGNIAPGEKIELKSVLDEKRVFKIKIKSMEAEKEMVWGDGKGERLFQLIKNEDGSCTFHMTETIGGLMFPMYAKYLPPFDENFEQYANDLKTEAELIQNNKN